MTGLPDRNPRFSTNSPFFHKPTKVVCKKFENDKTFQKSTDFQWENTILQILQTYKQEEQDGLNAEDLTQSFAQQPQISLLDLVENTIPTGNFGEIFPIFCN